MAQPAFVFCDSDALIQLFLVRDIRPLRVLRSKYSVQPVVTPEVEIELQSHRRFAARIAPELKKALDNGLLRLLDRSTLESHYGAPPGGTLAADAALAQIAKMGRQYQSYIDTGEAYTYAAAITVGTPALSHDRTALEALEKAGLPLPSTVLRIFDLICLAYQIGEMPVEDCEDFRKALIGEREFIPECFKNYSFYNGLKDFRPRIRDSRASDVGNKYPESFPYSTEIDL